MTIRTLSYDAIIVGGGGAGMRAALQLAQGGHKTAVVTKVFPTRSHTVSAQGRIYQRPFGGQSKGPNNPTQAARTCAAADRTGHALLHTLYQANLKAGTSFLNEWYAVDLVKNQDGAVVGTIAICIETGETVYIRSKAT